METFDHRIRATAGKAARGVIDRATVHDLGGTDGMIATRVTRGVWARLHPGVYQAGATTDDWVAGLRAAVLAAGEKAVASHRAALRLWGLDGMDVAPLEVTVPVGSGPVPIGVIVHRTRRPTPVEYVDGVRVTSVERTVLDLCAVLNELVVAKAVDSAIRMRLTTYEKLGIQLDLQGGRGVPGVHKIRHVLGDRFGSTAAGSVAESELAYRMGRAGIPTPVRQFPVRLANGKQVFVDFGWPVLGKGVEVDGLVAHASGEALERDLDRQNKLLDAGLAIRRFSARWVLRRPDIVIREIRQFLES